ncbi:MAG: acetylxylan esterase [Armatimonadetes bacterium]|nr:acetylxylan esterase [Armatimonadota bacterium]
MAAGGRWVRVVGLWWALLALPALAEVVVKVAPERAEAVYAVGEQATWTATVSSDGQACEGTVSYDLRRGGLTRLDSGKVELKSGSASFRGTLAEPGALLLTVTYEPVPGQRKQGWGGAVFNPDGIKASAPPPDDFDAFWEAKLAELAAVPMNAQVEPIPTELPDIEYARVTMDNIRGTRIYGQMAWPKGKTGLPAVLTVQWAGVYPLQRDWVIGEARRGRLVLNLMAHDLPFDRPKTYYDELSATTLKSYPGIGREDREQSYFLRMFLSCYRGADYLAQHPAWDGRNLLAQGGSQGGGQAVVAAGLHPAVSAISASVPALCDHTGQLVGRAAGWPKFTGWGDKPDSEAALKAAPYYDAVNFARRVKARSALVGVGLIDTTCPPEGVIAMYNALPCNKQLVIMPLSGHQGPGQDAFYRARESWLNALLTAAP